ncbi:MAG: T9SS type A sorting domain-containing protein [Ignavibacteria bacterium]|nr:T9SS type A sorting domain-containing protein [Ignavibacteria bacterium]
MKKLILVLFVVIISYPYSTNTQDLPAEKQKAQVYLLSKGEVYFSFEVFDKARINELSNVISIDNVDGHLVFAYANKDEFSKFLNYSIPFKVLPHPGDVDFDLKMFDGTGESNIMEWDAYPTYEAYVAMMNQFAATYPNLCRIVNAGTTIQGRQILFAVISDNVSTQEAEPKFMYTSSMHGDETTGYVLMLRLIDYLLSNYTAIQSVSSLVNGIEIWINPLANPDGTYHGGNSTVNGATRNNANGYDLNRNFPGVDGVNSQPLQTETQVFMNIASQNYFRLSANFHGGAEVVNYPWDCWQRLAADNNWWVRVSRKYADTVHAYCAPGYMNDLDNGITNGYAWYYVRGCRQDYMIYYRHGRESTIEISSTKLLPPTQLPALWNYNYRSLLNYIEQSLYGVNGAITDSVTGLPLKAKVTAVGFDIDSSEVYSDSLFGKYYRMAIQGNYNLMFTCPGYNSKTISGISVKNDSVTTLNVQLRPLINGITINHNLPAEFRLYQNYPNPFNPATTIKFDVPALDRNNSTLVTLVIYDILGKKSEELLNNYLKSGTYEINWDSKNYSSGVYYYTLSAGDLTITKKLVLIK